MARRDEYIKMSPSDFINPPYIKCPKCCKDTFGILGIGDHHYSRRCSSCYYPHPSRGEDSAIYPLPPLNKKVVYIDQFSISNMMKFLNPEAKSHKRVQPDIFWGELFDRLDTLCKLQLIICPDSVSHRHESLLSPYYKPLQRIYELLSHGISFKNDETIKLFQIIGQFKIWIGDTETLDLDVHKVVDEDINTWQERSILSVGEYNPQALIDEIRTNREKADKHLQEVFKRWQTEKDKDFFFWYEEEKKSEAGVLIELYNKDSKNITMMVLGLIPPDLGLLIPGFAHKVFYTIKKRLEEKGISGNENLNKKLGEFLRSKEFEDTPYIKIYSMLFAAMARRAAQQGRVRPPGRGFFTDVKIISTLLPYCDAMFIDNECRSLLLEKPLCDEISYGTKIFSLSNKEEFLEYLDTVKQNASAEHMKAIEEVYGTGWAKPYLEIFDNNVSF